MIDSTDQMEPWQQLKPMTYGKMYTLHQEVTLCAHPAKS